MTTSISDHAIQTLALTPSASPMRVLAAEDNPVFQSMLKTMLTKWGYQAVIARSGNEAWRVLESENAPRLGHPRLDDARHGWRGNLPPHSQCQSRALHLHPAAHRAHRIAGPDRRHGRRRRRLPHQAVQRPRTTRPPARRTPHPGPAGGTPPRPRGAPRTSHSRWSDRSAQPHRHPGKAGRRTRPRHAQRHTGIRPDGRSRPLQVDQRYLRATWPAMPCCAKPRAA